MTSSSIIDNIGQNTLHLRLKEISDGGIEICIATAFFSLDALYLIGDVLDSVTKVRILFGDDADARQRGLLLQKLRLQSDVDLLEERNSSPNLSALKKVEALFVAGKIEARCYTSKKFHAKAYLVKRPAYPKEAGILGSGNFTRAGLTQNIELNVALTIEQAAQLDAWFEARWSEAVLDDVTGDVLQEIRRQIDLYDPYVLYLKALTLWGNLQQDNTALVGSKLAETLDTHQLLGYRQALRILEYQHGVMVCDGVGLGKSFIALALIEKFCREGKNVLLIAPKSILVSSWLGYLKQYLSTYRAPFGSIFEIPMTGLGFHPDEESNVAKTREKTEELQRLTERADVIVVDESHNFRTPSVSRYKNLLNIALPQKGRRKKVILLTATPINTAYSDMSAQLSLIAPGDGTLIGGYRIEQVRSFARQLDKEEMLARLQMSLSLFETPNDSLNRVLESVLIQRSRKTCRELSRASGKELHFPKRRDPECLEYVFDGVSKPYSELVALADKIFRPGIAFNRELKELLDKFGVSEKTIDLKNLTGLKMQAEGIKLAAFLTEQYRKNPEPGKKVYQDEVRLAALVYANTLKQLESSPVAFQGIIQSLGLGLIARLRHVLGTQADSLIAPHRDWVQTSLFAQKQEALEDISEISTTEEIIESDTMEETVDAGESLDVSGEEADDWLIQAIRERGLGKKLAGFTEELFDVPRWTADIEGDLRLLKEIHKATLAVREVVDPKLKRVEVQLKKEIGLGGRVLVFTQSQRTATYLERELKARFPQIGIARIDSHVENTRQAILHAFCPGYNAAPDKHPPSVPKKVDILISTDVLAEGVNLQEATAILNYDIHWNPVRLIQRIGRVDRRLDPVVTPSSHEFSIYNVLPTKEIEAIIGLVGTVENRTLKISNTLGLDVSFFKSTDPAGNLKEFNSDYEGEMTKADSALTRFVNLAVKPPDAKTQFLLDQLPLGAFGVWKDAPSEGVFTLFTLEAKKTITEADREKFAPFLGYSTLCFLKSDGGRSFDAGEILEMLAGTTPGEHSANPSDEAFLSEQLKKTRNLVRDRFREVGLPQTIAPRLVCWMELKK
jgi:SNF2 family DNA or RNA helicase/HKD family nuclease